MSDDDNTYVLGVTRDADEALWSASGMDYPALSQMLTDALGHTITGPRALQQAAVLVCLDVLAQDIAKARLQLVQKLPGGNMKVVDALGAGSTPMAEMLALEPNERHTWIEFVQMVVYHLVMRSNSYAYIKRNRVGDVLELVPLQPGQVSERINQTTGEVFYDINASTVQEMALLGQGRWSFTAPERDVIHFRQRMLDGFWGYSTLTAGGRAISLGSEIESFQRNQLSANPTTRGFFSREKGAGELSNPAFLRIKDQLRRLLRRGADGEPMLLEDGIKFEEFTFKGSDTEITKLFDKHVETVCRLWRMPPHKVMHLSAVKYENLATLEMVYVRDTLVPICRLIESRMEKALLDRRDRLRYGFMFNRDDMVVADEEQEREWVTQMTDRSAITINEARVAAGWNPVPWGETRFVPANGVLIDEQNNVVASGAAAAGGQSQEPADQNDAGDPPAEDEAQRGLRLVSG